MIERRLRNEQSDSRQTDRDAERPTLLWFRSDLRLSDNPALTAAVERGAPIVPVFIWAPEEEGAWVPGEASRWWLDRSLEALKAELQKRGSRLIIRRGPSVGALNELIAESGASGVFWNRRYEPATVRRDRVLKTLIERNGTKVADFTGSLLFEPGTILNKGGQPFRVFSPFWRSCLSASVSPPSSIVPRRLRAPERWPDSLEVTALGLAPTFDREAGFRKSWKPGESGAAAALRRFGNEALQNYRAGRDQPGVGGTSRLSPHLHFGEVSPAQVWRAIRGRSHEDAGESYLRQIGWREFAYHVLSSHPASPQQPLRSDFARFPWRAHPRMLKAWQRGQTGYPLVDAGMRELWHTGWMHNRVRMVAASFLVKHLLISWREGAAWFWDRLVDADLANNTFGWQWVAGCGADAAPYFRIFNPVLQGEKFDPSGDYVRRFVPELAGLPDQWLHKPWKAPASILREARVELGRNYPRPIVDHGSARRRALAALGTIGAKRKAWSPALS
jgi:deoxyribodipyrimidine photo-lyase